MALSSEKRDGQDHQKSDVESVAGKDGMKSALERRQVWRHSGRDFGTAFSVRGVHTIRPACSDRTGAKTRLHGACHWVAAGGGVLCEQKIVSLPRLLAPDDAPAGGVLQEIRDLLIVFHERMVHAIFIHQCKASCRRGCSGLRHDAQMFEAVKAGIDEDGLGFEGPSCRPRSPIVGTPGRLD